MLGCPTSDAEIPFLDLLCEVSKVPFSITTHRLCHTAPVWSAPSRGVGPTGAPRCGTMWYEVV